MTTVFARTLYFCAIGFTLDIGIISSKDLLGEHLLDKGEEVYTKVH
jgi:hypothetical protein